VDFGGQLAITFFLLFSSPSLYILLYIQLFRERDIDVTEKVSKRKHVEESTNNVEKHPPTCGWYPLHNQ
jgi:hypothetical protein